MRLEFTPSVDRLTATAVRELTVGLRTTEAVVEQHSGGRSFLINGAPIFLAGGNWIGTDQLLRYSTDRERYYNEVRMHKEMGMNLIRVWGGGLTERPEFYEAADELGMLVMQEFWMTGDNNGRWAGDNDWPNDHSLYLSCAADMMRMIRNHPSLLFWCGGNELLPKIGQAGWQMDLIDHKLRNLVSELDRTRFYIPSSMGTYTCKKEKGCKWGPYAPDVKHNNTFSLAPSDGPYNVLDEQQYYMPGAGGTVDAGGDDTGGGIVFQPETGNLATPTHASLQRFLSPEVVADFPTRGADPEGHVNATTHAICSCLWCLRGSSLTDRLLVITGIQRDLELPQVYHDDRKGSGKEAGSAGEVRSHLFVRRAGRHGSILQAQSAHAVRTVQGAVRRLYGAHVCVAGEDAEGHAVWVHCSDLLEEPESLAGATWCVVRQLLGDDWWLLGRESCAAAAACAAESTHDDTDGNQHESRDVSVTTCEGQCLRSAERRGTVAPRAAREHCGRAGAA